MIPFHRVLEICLFSLLGLLPFVNLALFPFRKQLRFSRPATLALIILACLLHTGLNLLQVFYLANPGLLSFLLTCICLLLYWVGVRDRFDKLLFTGLALFTIFNLALFVAKGLERLCFPTLAAEPYRWSLCLCLLIIHMALTPALYFYIRKWYAPTMELQTPSWHYLWSIPATFYLIWHYHLFSTGQSSIQAVQNAQSTLFLLSVSLGAFIVYHTVVLLLLEQEKAQTLAQQNHLLSMQRLQYDNLQYRINEARQAKHDVRHHAHLIREYLRSGKLRELDAYLDHYSKSMPDSPSLVYCQHYATNALLGYFVQQAQSSEITMDIFVQLPEQLNLPETTISVVLGNLLENAVDACREISTGERKITVRGKTDMGSVFFEITNTYAGTLRKNKAGKLLSGKASGRGLGLDSVAHLAQVHGGMLELDAQNGIFRASILLPEQTPQA